MSDGMSVAATATHVEHAGHEKLGFVRTYIFSTDHKMIARQFLFLGLFMMILGGLMALMIRWELAWPETQVPGTRWIPEPFMTDGYMNPSFYNQLFTMHATIMVFFVVMPILVGCFGNFLIPLMIGTRDMAFPVLNMLSFWVGAVSGVVMLAGFFVPGGHAAGGWTSYAPLTAVTQYTGVNWGQNLWCISLIILGISSLMGSINYITTIVNMRAPGMTFFRLPLVDLVPLHRSHPSLAGAAGPDVGAGDALAGPHGRDELLPASRRWRAAALAAPLLVLRPS